MPALPVLSGRKAARTFERLGWHTVRQRRSHIIMVNVKGRMDRDTLDSRP